MTCRFPAEQYLAGGSCASLRAHAQGDSLGINTDRVLFISVCTFNQIFCSFQQDADSIPVRGIWFKSAETEHNQDL